MHGNELSVSSLFDVSRPCNTRNAKFTVIIRQSVDFGGYGIYDADSK